MAWAVIKLNSIPRLDHKKATNIIWRAKKKLRRAFSQPKMLRSNIPKEIVT